MINQIHCCDCIDAMRALPDSLVHLTVTSPPFDNIRNYDGWLSAFDFEAIAAELYRVTCEGGVVCWHVQNQIVKGSETGTAEKQKLRFRDIGFRLYNTIIVETNGAFISNGRYGGAPHYVYVLSKGKPRCFDPIKDVRNLGVGQTKSYHRRNQDGSFLPWQYSATLGEYRQRGYVWRYFTGKNHMTERGYEYEHPAIMHIKLARDLIRSWSAPCDLVFDPMCGEGTVPLAARELKRHYLGMEISPYWAERAKRRLVATNSQSK